MEAAYQQHAVALERFLLGILKDEASASDALQSTFAQLIRKGHVVDPGSVRSWLFRVAYNQAMLIFRQQATRRQVTEKAAWMLKHEQQSRSEVDSVDEAMRIEDIHVVREALECLPAEQLRVVQMRIYDNLKFRQISEQLGVPLGTVLSRMQSALKKLRTILNEKQF